MPFKKGISGNAKGKPKGSKNRTSEGVRSLLLEFVNNNLETIQEEYNKLEGEKKLLYLEKLFRHVLPPMITSLSQLSESDLDLLIQKLKDENAKNTGN